MQIDVLADTILVRRWCHDACMQMLMLVLHDGALMHADVDAGTGAGPVAGTSVAKA